MRQRIATKYQEALAILERCIGRHGVWADPSRYAWQCWTRDFGLAVQPALLTIGSRAAAREHLANLSERARPNGQIPILYLDGLRGTAHFLADKARRSLETGRMSFMLRRFLEGELWNLTPGTRDSELLYLVAMHEYAATTGDRSLLTRYHRVVVGAAHYLETHLLRDGLVFGCDWRDTMEQELGNTHLLTNNALLFHAYRLMGEYAKASALQRRIEETFWTGSLLRDRPGYDRFDPLGGALAVLVGLVPPERFGDVRECFRSVDSPHGVTIKCRHNPLSSREAAIIERTDGVVVWPFVVGFSALALLKMGERAMAEAQFSKLAALDGFREWYDPADGAGCGAEQQLWSATLFIRSAITLGFV